MYTVDLDGLNAQFAVAGHVSFRVGYGGLPVADIANIHATATISLHGAHVTAFQPHGQDPVLWLSDYCCWEAGKAIRGGIPVCWPWFAAHPADSGKPAHGFVRTAMWKVMATEALANGATQITFGFTESEATLALWPYAFRLEMVVTVGAVLQVELVAHNTGNKEFICGGALHSYFRVNDVTEIAVRGLEGCTYIDSLDLSHRKLQEEPVTISSETDRIYVDTTADCTIDDPGMGRRIRIVRKGSRSVVVWNPWKDKAARMEDFGDQEYLGMICVETANAADDVVMVPSMGEHRLQTVISVE